MYCEVTYQNKDGRITKRNFTWQHSRRCKKGFMYAVGRDCYGHWKQFRLSSVVSFIPLM